jgi:quercetin dioxygenase-like cupin family protein
MTEERRKFEEGNEERAALYALGALSQSEARAYEAEATAHDIPLARDFASVVPWLAFAAPAATPPRSLRAHLLARTEAETGPSSPSASGSSGFQTIHADEGSWEPCFPGSWIKPLYTNESRGTRTFLLRIEPGGVIPAHHHLSVEEFYVIAGQCRINDEDLQQGDYRVALPGTTDQTITTENGALVLIVGPTGFEMLEP